MKKYCVAKYCVAKYCAAIMLASFAVGTSSAAERKALTTSESRSTTPSPPSTTTSPTEYPEEKILRKEANGYNPPLSHRLTKTAYSVAASSSDVIMKGAIIGAKIYDTARRTTLTSDAEYIFSIESDFTNNFTQKDKILLMTTAFMELDYSISRNPDNRLLRVQPMMLFEISQHNGIYNYLDYSTRKTIESLIRSSSNIPPQTRDASTQTDCNELATTTTTTVQLGTQQLPEQQ